MDLFPVVSLGILVAAVTAMIAIRFVRARERARRRVVERPNSHYTSPVVRESQARHRWHNMPLERIHEINREEVVRLLAKVEGTGVDALRESERTFLDHIAEMTGTPPAPERREKASGIAPDLRPHPA